MATPITTLKEKARRMRVLSLKATTEAGSGHPSSCLSAADLASVIFFQEMRFDPTSGNMDQQCRHQHLCNRDDVTR